MLLIIDVTMFCWAMLLSTGKPCQMPQRLTLPLCYILPSQNCPERFSGHWSLWECSSVNSYLQICRVILSCKLHTLIRSSHMHFRDTYWVESFNHQLLCYLSKRIHYSTATYRMRMNLAVLDWVCTKLNFISYKHLSYMMLIEWECMPTLHKWTFLLRSKATR